MSPCSYRIGVIFVWPWKKVSVTVCYLFYQAEVKKIITWACFSAKLFTVPYSSLRSSRSSALRYGWPSGFQCPESSLTKKAARTDKRSILRILRKSRGLRHPSIVQSTAHLPLSTVMENDFSAIFFQLGMCCAWSSPLSLFSKSKILIVLFVCCFSFDRGSFLLYSESIVSTLRFRITFKANVKLCHVIKFSLFLSPTVYHNNKKRRFRFIYNYKYLRQF